MTALLPAVPHSRSWLGRAAKWALALALVLPVAFCAYLDIVTKHQPAWPEPCSEGHPCATLKIPAELAGEVRITPPMGIQLRDESGEVWTIRLDGVRASGRVCTDDVGISAPCNDEWLALSDFDTRRWTCRPKSQDRHGAVIAVCHARPVTGGPPVDVGERVKHAQAR